MATPDNIMAVVHVTAPSEVNPNAIEAELCRAVSGHRKLALTAEIVRAEDVRSQPSRGTRRHGYVTILSLAEGSSLHKIRRRVQKAMRKALHSRFGDEVTADVSTKTTPAERAAYWCTVRGTPHRHH